MNSKYGTTAAETIMNEKQLNQYTLPGQEILYSPVEDPNYEWRLRVDIRSGTNMPFNST